MSITILRNESDFIYYNPWFELSIKNRVRRELENQKYLIKDEIHTQFPILWRHHMLSDPEWIRLKEKLNEHTNLNISRINSATERKVSELVDSPQFEPLKAKIFDTTLNRYENFQKDLERRHLLIEEQRDAKLKKFESDVNDIRNNQFLTFFGATILGFAIGFSVKN